MIYNNHLAHLIAFESLNRKPLTIIIKQIHFHPVDLSQTAIDGSMLRQIIFRDSLIPLDAYSDTEFIACYRITRSMFTELLDRWIPLRFDLQVDHTQYPRQLN